MPIDCYTKYARPAVSARIKPEQSACQLDVLTTTLPAPLVMTFFNIVAIDVGLRYTQVPNSCRKWHEMYILVLIQSPLYMSHTILR